MGHIVPSPTPAGAFATGGLWKLAEVDLAAPAANFDFTGIVSDGTYAHLKLMLQLRSDTASTVDNVNIALNNDTTAANYDAEATSNVGGTVTGAEALGTSRFIGACPAATSPANQFGAIEITLFNYTASTFKLLTAFGFSWESRATGNLRTRQYGMGWASLAAVNRITITPASAGNFVAGSTASLYGIKKGA